MTQSQEKKQDHENRFKSPLGVARGMGSARDGTRHWVHERATGIISTPLMLWLVWSVTQNAFLDYAGFIAWQAQPVNAVLMILSVMVVFYHTALGAQVVMDDYMHQPALKIIMLAAVRLFFFAATLAVVFSILQIAFAG